MVGRAVGAEELHEDSLAEHESVTNAMPAGAVLHRSADSEHGGLRISRLGEGLLKGSMTEIMRDGMAGAADAQLALREEAERVKCAPAPVLDLNREHGITGGGVDLGGFSASGGWRGSRVSSG